MGVNCAAVWSTLHPSSTDWAENDSLCRNLDGQRRGVCRHILTCPRDACMHTYSSSYSPLEDAKQSIVKSVAGKECLSTTQVDMPPPLHTANIATREPKACSTEWRVLMQVAYRVGTGGSCGFGPIGDPYPDSAIASIRSSSDIVAQLPESGCGACIQLTCADQVCSN